MFELPARLRAHRQYACCLDQKHRAPPKKLCCNLVPAKRVAVSTMLPVGSRQYLKMTQWLCTPAPVVTLDAVTSTCAITGPPVTAAGMQVLLQLSPPPNPLPTPAHTPPVEPPLNVVQADPRQDAQVPQALRQQLHTQVVQLGQGVARIRLLETPAHHTEPTSNDVTRWVQCQSPEPTGHDCVKEKNGPRNSRCHTVLRWLFGNSICCPTCQ